MRVNLKLSTKGTIIVCGLLSAELIFLGGLGYLLWEAELETKRYEHSNAILAKVTGLLKLIVDAGTSLGAYVVLQTPSLGERYDQIVATIPEQTSELKQLCKEDKNASLAMAKIDRIDHLLTTAFDDLNRFRRRIATDGNVSSSVLRRSVQETFSGLLKELRDFNEDVKSSVAKSSPETAHRYRQMVLIAIASLIGVNIVAALLIMRLFTTGIVRKLDVLTANAVRLGAGVPLLARLDGQDELSQLDATFHFMADELVKASQKERDATSAAQASEERVRAIIENMPLGLIAIEASGRVQAVNPKAEQIFGYSANEIVGKHIGTLFTEKAADASESFVERLKQDSAKGTTEYTAKRKSAEAFPIEIALNEFQSREGNMLLVNVCDVTERHEVERLKRDFVAMVSHDLRSPLTSVHGSLTLLSAGALGDLSDEAQEVVQTAESEVERLTNLVADLLDVARIEAGKLEVHPTRTQLMPIIRRSIASVGNLAARAGVEIDCEQTTPVVMADSDRIVQVMVNLLSNAIKFSPPQTTVSVTARDLNDWVEVRVEDRGRGIPAEHLDAIFERFHQVESDEDTKKGGTGLGLPICKTIVENHGGQIGVESEVGKGSTFWFRLKKSPDAPAAPEPSQTPGSAGILPA
jgi:PAS domain S-box-containing protein